ADRAAQPLVPGGITAADGRPQRRLRARERAAVPARAARRGVDSGTLPGLPGGGERRAGRLMRICLMVEGQENVSWEQWCALADACEASGLDGLFRSDHYLSTIGSESRGTLDAWTTLAGLAARTKRIRLGTLVSPVTFRHPAVLAKSAATVDHISGGRV